MPLAILHDQVLCIPLCARIGPSPIDIEHCGRRCMEDAHVVSCAVAIVPCGFEQASDGLGGHFRGQVGDLPAASQRAHRSEVVDLMRLVPVEQRLPTARIADVVLDQLDMPEIGPASGGGAGPGRTVPTTRTPSSPSSRAR